MLQPRLTLTLIPLCQSSKCWDGSPVVSHLAESMLFTALPGFPPSSSPVSQVHKNSHLRPCF